jgi:signal peptidase I
MNAEAADSSSWVRTITIGRNPRNTLLRILLLVSACFVTFRFVLLPIHVEGGSMLPTYRDHRVNFVNLLAYQFSEPKRGDVVTIKLAGRSVMFMKRIIALPGETIAFHRGHAVINGQLLEEPYVKNSCDWEIPSRTLGADEYYFVGDNRSMPEYDHTKGVAQRARIAGKVLL